MFSAEKSQTNVGDVELSVVAASHIATVAAAAATIAHAASWAALEASTAAADAATWSVESRFGFPVLKSLSTGPYN